MPEEFDAAYFDKMCDFVKKECGICPAYEKCRDYYAAIALSAACDVYIEMQEVE